MYKGKKVILRAHKEDDIAKLNDFINDYEVKRLLNIETSFPLALWQEEEWVKKRRDNDQTYDFAIEDLESGCIIGGCSINSTSIKNRNCIIGIMIGDKDYWGKGYGYDALSVLIKFIFEECNMEKIKLGAFSLNPRAIACYKKLGFKEEGRLKREIYREGKYHDEILMALFKEEYFENMKDKN
ncbi:GNAT family protein [Clostridium sardiniense]|uniref:GNAT family N-acetyltransferase n=1 Tax=Clostridium sardiniense TaxID=29369 RepID=UPI001957B6D8|nr:GNAT family protein [Clostridium sardiniense]MBM7834500.1 RimJ/RimL family protein N-acetyltransferase [Clostridium sardiniense]